MSTPPTNLFRSRDTPHIRLNSATQDLTLSDSSNYHSTSHQRLSFRSLVSPRHISRSDDALQDCTSPIPESSSTEHLLAPPSRSASARRRDESPQASTLSHRYSLESQSTPGKAEYSAFDDWYDDSGSSSFTTSVGEDRVINTQTAGDKFNITPSSRLLVFPHDLEGDDLLHNPDPRGVDDRRDWSVFNTRALVNLGGLVLIVFGLLAIFMGYPVLTFIIDLADPLDRLCKEDPECISSKAPLLNNVRHGSIDPDTPESAHKRTDADGHAQSLVFSDEFNSDGRTFYDGDDPFFQAVDLWYGVTQDLEVRCSFAVPFSRDSSTLTSSQWYDPDAISTANGTLNIQFDAYPNHGLEYRSGMLQSWNKMCFKGGHVEASISLPGAGNVIGFWPGFWAMGNLGRPGYPATTEGMWPYTYWDRCDIGITANQSSGDGLSHLPGMKMPACTCNPEDLDQHPTPGKSRSAPEIDALEGNVIFLNRQFDHPIGSGAQSLQCAPFDPWYQPDYDYVELYDRAVTSMNAYRGGPYQEALSAITNLNNMWYENHAYQSYGFEIQPSSITDPLLSSSPLSHILPADHLSPDGHVTFFIGHNNASDPADAGRATWKVDARALRPNGNVGWRVIPVEPLALIFNVGMSPTFAPPYVAGVKALLPATMRIDYIRIYQDDAGFFNGRDMWLSCDPPGYETTRYIARHGDAYGDWKKQRWKDTGYPWPKNSFVDGSCAN